MIRNLVTSFSLNALMALKQFGGNCFTFGSNIFSEKTRALLYALPRVHDCSNDKNCIWIQDKILSLTVSHNATQVHTAEFTLLIKLPTTSLLIRFNTPKFWSVISSGKIVSI